MSDDRLFDYQALENIEVAIWSALDSLDETKDLTGDHNVQLSSAVSAFMGVISRMEKE